MFMSIWYIHMCVYISHIWHIYLSIHPYNLLGALRPIYVVDQIPRVTIDHLWGHPWSLCLGIRAIWVTWQVDHSADWHDVNQTRLGCQNCTDMLILCDFHSHGTQDKFTAHSSAPILGFEHWADIVSCTSVLWPWSTASKSGKDRNRHSLLELVITCI